MEKEMVEKIRVNLKFAHKKTGDWSDISGDASKISGDASGLRGDVTGIKGDAEEIKKILTEK